MTSPPLHGLVHLFDGKKENEMIWDDTHYPIITLVTIGVPTVDLMTQAYALREPVLAYAKANDIHVVIISDLSNFKTPDAVTRKALTELVKKNDAPYMNVMLATVFIVTNPLMRGVITAVSWVAGDGMVPNFYSANLASALNETRKLYSKVGKEMPDFPEDYQFARQTLSATA